MSRKEGNCRGTFACWASGFFKIRRSFSEDFLRRQKARPPPIFSSIMNEKEHEKLARRCQNEQFSPQKKPFLRRRLGPPEKALIFYSNPTNLLGTVASKVPRFTCHRRLI